MLVKIGVFHPIHLTQENIEKLTAVLYFDAIEALIRISRMIYVFMSF